MSSRLLHGCEKTSLHWQTFFRTLIRFRMAILLTRDYSHLTFIESIEFIVHLYLSRWPVLSHVHAFSLSLISIFKRKFICIFRSFWKRPMHAAWAFLRHPSNVLYNFLEHSSFAGAFSQKTVKCFWTHMKDAFFLSINFPVASTKTG